MCVFYVFGVYSVLGLTIGLSVLGVTILGSLLFVCLYVFVKYVSICFLCEICVKFVKYLVETCPYFLLNICYMYMCILNIGDILDSSGLTT